MSRTRSIDQLAEELRPAGRGTVALVGGGGKTTALFALGRQLAGTVLLSTTTKMGSDRTGGHRPLIDPSDETLEAALERERVVLCWRAVEDHRAEGFDAAQIDAWSGFADHVVVEADGSRRRPFKAPAAHEPVVPAGTTTLVACVGAAAFDLPIEQACHRPEIVADIARCAVGDRLTAGRLAAVLSSAEGSRKHCPPGARFVVLLNQVTEEHDRFVDSLEAALDGAAPIIAIAPFAPSDSPEV